MPKQPRTRFVFVYGTLKRGGENHAVLADQTFVGPARLTPGFAMYSIGEYPGLVAEPAARERVTGEIWAVGAAALARLDALEGVDEGLYARVPAALDERPPALPADATVELYLYLRDVSGRPRLGDTWAI